MVSSIADTECSAAQHHAALSWSNVHFEVVKRTLLGKKTSTKTILNSVTGSALPSEVVAIMGPSGSGKTSLLDILADRVSSGTIGGEVFLNGKPRTAKAYRAVTAYVAQEDTLIGSFTVLETLRQSAQIALPAAVTAAEREARVQHAVDSVGLRSAQHVLVGDMFRKGISGGQKRRLSIAIELLKKPSILLLDEPTSGLDSASALAVMQHLNKLAKEDNCTVVVTIHQPSGDVWNSLDKVCFLVEGNVVYFDSPKNVPDYFERLGYPVPAFTNPAEHALGIVNTDFEGHGDVPAIIEAYNMGHISAKRGYTAAGMDMHVPSDKEAWARVKPSMLRQFWALLLRNFLNNVRNPGIYWVRLMMYFILSFMIGTMYIKSNEAITQMDQVNLLFYVFSFLVFMAVAVLPFFDEIKAVFARERANSNLSVLMFCIANFLAALPGVAIIAGVSTALIVGIAGLHSTGWFFLNLFLAMVASESMMMLLGAATPHYIIGIAVGSGIYGMFMLVCGFMVPTDRIPSGWMWAHYIAMHSYAFQTAVVAEMEGRAPGGDDVIAYFNMQDVSIGNNMIILAAYTVILQILFFAVLFFKHTGRR